MGKTVVATGKTVMPTGKTVVATGKTEHILQSRAFSRRITRVLRDTLASPP